MGMVGIRMTRITGTLAIAIFVFCFTLSGCSEIANTQVDIKVIGVGTNFTGFYIKDDSTPQGIDGTIDAYGNYIFEKEIKDLDNIEVHVERLTTARTLQIKIYRDGDKVKESSLESSETSTNKLVLEYQVGEEDTSS